LLCGLAVFVTLVLYVPQWVLRTDDTWSKLTPSQKYKAVADLRSALLQTVGGFVLAVGAITAIRQYLLARAQSSTDRAAKYVEAFTKAIEQLASENAATSTAGIYALDRLASTYPEESQRIVEILTSFITSRRKDADLVIPTAIAAVSRHRSSSEVVNLSGSYLANMKLRNLDLHNINFDKCDLRDADFGGSRLDGSTFEQADISRIVLTGASVRNTKLRP